MNKTLILYALSLTMYSTKLLLIFSFNSLGLGVQKRLFYCPQDARTVPRGMQRRMCEELHDTDNNYA